MKMVKRYRKNVSLSDLWVSSNEKLSDFYVSSWQRGESPVPLLVMRLVLASVAVAILIWSVVVAPNPHWLVFLTNWGLTLVVMTTLSGVLVSCIALRKKSFDGEELPWYVSMYWFLFNIAVTIAIMITALYWILLYDPDPEDPDTYMFWLDVATHGVNSCVALAELLVSRTPVRFLHIYQPIGLGFWYAAFSAIFYAAGGTVNGHPFIYEVLDWSQGKRAGAVVGASVAGMVVLYLALWGVAFCRDKVSTFVVRTTSHDLPLAPPDRHMIDGVA